MVIDWKTYSYRSLVMNSNRIIFLIQSIKWNLNFIEFLFYENKILCTKSHKNNFQLFSYALFWKLLGWKYFSLNTIFITFGHARHVPDSHESITSYSYTTVWEMFLRTLFSIKICKIWLNHSKFVKDESIFAFSKRDNGFSKISHFQNTKMGITSLSTFSTRENMLEDHDAHFLVFKTRNSRERIFAKKPLYSFSRFENAKLTG